jgi:hypothetical protein
MIKVLFLDIDGVLNPKWWNGGKPSDKYGVLFEAKAVDNLKKIIEKTGADIVISSSWKCMGLSELRKMWKERKLPGRIIDITPDYLSEELLLNPDLNNDNILYNRGCEIKGWLSKYGDEVSNYAIIDDMDDILPEQQPHFVWTDEEIGLTEGNAIQAIMILNHLKCE